MTTKLSFRVFDTREKRYLSGWQELQTHGMGIMHDNDDPTKISICFFKEPDDYFKIEEVKEEGS